MSASDQPNAALGDAMPALFLAHGAPNLPIGAHPAKRFLSALAAGAPRPRAILVVSAHWETARPTLGVAPQPETIYDFHGFEPELRRIVYPARTDAAVVARVADLLNAAGIAVDQDPDRGFDHGVWVPLHIAYPQADIPVVQLSLERDGDAARHLAIGRALAPLRAEGVLIVGSGAVVHNLRALQPEGSAPPDWAVAFDDWVADAIDRADWAALTAFPHAPPGARQAHPTPEHLWPLFVALGAGGAGVTGRALHRSFSYGAISMASYAFDGAPV